MRIFYIGYLIWMKTLDLLQLQTSLEKFLAKGSKPDTNLFLSPEETQETIHHAINAWKSREKHYEKLE